MTLTTLEQEIVAQLHSLDVPQQQAVLAFVRTLAIAPVGVPGSALLAFAGAIDRHELESLKQAVDEDCGQVDVDEW